MIRRRMVRPRRVLMQIPVQQLHLTAIPAPAILPEAEVPALVQVPAPAAALPAVASPVVEAADMDLDLVDGDGKQQFTVEIRSLVDSICDKTGSVLSLFR